MRSLLPVAAFLALSALLAPRAWAQEDANKKAIQILLDKAEDEYRTYFKQPKTTLELWAAIKFEIDVGKFDLAAFHLKRLLTNDKAPAEKVDEDLFKIETAEGMASLLRLIRVQRWSDHGPFQKEAEENVKVFFERVSGIVEKKLADPDRIRKFIKQLDAETPEERAFAFKELNRSRERAVPYLVEKLRESIGHPLYQKVIDAMVAMDKETAPAYFEVLKSRNDKDAADPELRLALLRILRLRGETRCMPYLWHLSAGPKYPTAVRDAAKRMLGDFLSVDPEVLRPAKLVLAELSDKHFKHEIPYPNRVRLWKWDGEKIDPNAVELTKSDAEELFGIRHAIEALDLDPSFEPAQLAFLNLSVERALLPEFDQAVLRPLPTHLQRLLATVDPELLISLQDRAFDDGNVPVLLGITHALGNRGETRAARPSTQGRPQGVVRGLYFPDRRVQYQSALSLLKIPTGPAPVAAGRVVEVLRRLVTAEQPPAGLVIGASAEKANEVAVAVKAAGLAPILAKNANDGLQKIRGRGDVEAIFLHHAAGVKEIPYALNQLRADYDHGLVPVIAIVPPDQIDAAKRSVARYRNVAVISESTFPSADETKKVVEDLTTRVAVMKLSAEERKRMAEVSLDVLRQMARNQIPGYDVRPSLENVAVAMQSPDLAPIAFETLSHIPGSVPQIRLAAVVLDPAKDKLRVGAARELHRHVQHNGLLLPKSQVDRIRGLYKAPDTEVALKTELSYFMGAFRSTPTRDGNLILQYRPDLPAAPPVAEKKE